MSEPEFQEIVRDVIRFRDIKEKPAERFTKADIRYLRSLGASEILERLYEDSLIDQIDHTNLKAADKILKTLNRNNPRAGELKPLIARYLHLFNA